jgi:hypothetical protein
MAGFSYDRYDTRRGNGPATRSKSVLGWWMPVMVTTTLAAGGLIAWALRARDDHDHSSEEDDDALSYGGETDQEGKFKPGPGQRPPGVDIAGEASQQVTTEDSTLIGRVQSAIRRTPSPQQILDGAGKKVAAGVAAAGAMMGGALGSIKEDHEDDFADHARWKDTVNAASASGSGSRTVYSGKRKTVAIVLSADEGDVPLEEEEEKGYRNEYAVSRSCSRSN